MRDKREERVRMEEQKKEPQLEPSIEKQSKGKKILAFLKRKKKWLKWIIILIIIVVVVMKIRANVTKQIGQMTPKVKTTTMEKRDLEMTLTGSGVIEPQDQYTVVPLVQGEILSAPFEEGQQVKKGDLLYEIDTKEVQNSIKSAKLNVQQAQNAYDDAVKAKDDLILTSNVSGYIKDLKVKEGDMVTAGMQIADIYDNTTMYLTVPFNTMDVKGSWVGKKAVVFAGEDEERLTGTVVEVSPVTETLSGGRIVKQVKISVVNPGGLTDGLTGIATVDGVECNDEGTFSVKEQTTLLASGSGEISSLNIKKGEKIKDGQTYATLKGDTVDSQIKNAKTALESAQLTLESQQDSLDNYKITAPISGQVITKTKKKGDKISMSSQTSAEGMSLAVIYDLSSLKFEMKVDELDIKNVKVGQKVEVTCEALEGKKMTGHVENISLKSVSQNGVTQYPVLVRMDKVYDLLPGMNVDSKIIVKKEKQVDSLPLECLKRGNVVYVKEEGSDSEQNTTKKTGTEALTATQNGGIPAGFKEVNVQVGIDDGDYVQIKSGLQEGDQIYVPSPQQSTLDMYMSGAYAGDSSSESSSATE